MKNVYKILLLPIILLVGYVLYKRVINEKKNEEKVLHMEANRQIVTLDPTMVEDATSWKEVCNVYEGLLEFHYLKRPAELVPNLAEDLPQISENGLVYTFKIKKNVYFQNNKCFKEGKGKVLTAHDFVYSMKRVADPKVQAPLFPMIEGRIRGLNEWRERNAKKDQTDYTDKVEGIVALDDYTLQITLTAPWPQFLYSLMLPFNFAIPKEAVDYYGKEIVNHPVGTGPFIIDNFNAQENKIVASKNPTFRDKFYPSEASEELKYLLGPAGKKIPFVDKVITYVIVEDQTRWLKFLNGSIDILDLNEASDLGDKITAEKPIDELCKKGIKLMKRPFAHTSMYCFNVSKKPFDNIYLRQAMSLAYDRYKENQLFNNKIHTVAQAIIPPVFGGYESDFMNEYTQINIDKAKELLAKAGYPEGKGLDPIVLDIKQGAQERQQAEFFQKCMEQIGIKIIIELNSMPELINKANTKRTQIFKMKWFADYPDAENYLALFYKAHRGGGVYTYYNDEAYNTMYEEAFKAKDSKEREELYKKMNRYLAEKLPCLPQTHNSKILMFYEWVLNYEFMDSKYDYTQYIDIDMEKKKALLKK